jgi:hypothetical protein
MRRGFASGFVNYKKVHSTRSRMNQSGYLEVDDVYCNVQWSIPIAVYINIMELNITVVKQITMCQIYLIEWHNLTQAVPWHFVVWEHVLNRRQHKNKIILLATRVFKL